MPSSLDQLKAPFRKNGVVTIELKATDWEAGDFEPLLEDLTNHGEVITVRFIEDLAPEELGP